MKFTGPTQILNRRFRYPHPYRSLRQQHIRMYQSFLELLIIIGYGDAVPQFVEILIRRLWLD